MFFRKLMELEQLKQQVGEIIFFLQGRNFFYTEERKSENQKFRTMELLDSRTEHTNSIQLFNDLIKQIVQRGEQVLCSGISENIYSFMN